MKRNDKRLTSLSFSLSFGRHRSVTGRQWANMQHASSCRRKCVCANRAKQSYWASSNNADNGLEARPSLIIAGRPRLSDDFSFGSLRVNGHV